MAKKSKSKSAADRVDTRKDPLDTVIDDGREVDPTPTKKERAADQRAVENKTPTQDIDDVVKGDREKVKKA